MKRSDLHEQYGDWIVQGTVALVSGRFASRGSFAALHSEQRELENAMSLAERIVEIHLERKGEEDERG